MDFVKSVMLSECHPILAKGMSFYDTLLIRCIQYSFKKKTTNQNKKTQILYCHCHKRAVSIFFQMDLVGACLSTEHIFITYVN